MPEYDHSQVARKVATAFDEETRREVRSYSGSSDVSSQYVVLDSPPVGHQLQTVMEETDCAVTHFEGRGERPFHGDEQGWRVWFGYVDVGIDGPSFVDRQRPL